MASYWHNIGKPDLCGDDVTLWRNLRANSVVTAGYGNQPAGKRARVVERYEAGDTIFAYANEFGLIGYCRGLGAETARLRDEPRNGSHHRHETSVKWAGVRELDEAISPAILLQNCGVRHPDKPVSY